MTDDDFPPDLREHDRQSIPVAQIQVEVPQDEQFVPPPPAQPDRASEPFMRRS